MATEAQKMLIYYIPVCTYCRNVNLTLLALDILFCACDWIELLS